MRLSGNIRLSFIKAMIIQFVIGTCHLARGIFCSTISSQSHSQSMAHQLLLNGRVPNRQPKVRLDRQRYPDDPGFTRAFTAEELDIGIRVLKNGKAPGLDDIQMELIKQFGPKARNFFNNCTETKKIPKIWRQAKVVALVLLKPGVTGQESSRARSSPIWEMTNHGEISTPHDQS